MLTSKLLEFAPTELRDWMVDQGLSRVSIEDGHGRSVTVELAVSDSDLTQRVEAVANRVLPGLVKSAVTEAQQQLVREFRSAFSDAIDQAMPKVMDDLVAKLKDAE